ncbi:MAG: hypothetical protein ACRDT0_19370 [Pseudonocardiaceae bacterium]
MIRVCLPALPALVISFAIKDMPWQAQLAVLLSVYVLGLVVFVTCEVLRYQLGKQALQRTDPAQVADVVAAVIGRQRPEDPRT